MYAHALHRVTHQDDLFDVLGRAPVKHPCRVIPLHVHVHVLNLLVAGDEERVVSTEDTHTNTHTSFRNL